VGIHSVDETTAWLRNEVWLSPCGNRWISDPREVGVRRTISANRPDGGGPSRHDYAELHADGCGFAAVQLRQDPPNPLDGQNPEWAVNETSIVDIATALTGLLARHALRQGVAGEAVAELRIIALGGPIDLRLPQPMALMQNRFHGIPQSSTTRRLTLIPASRHTIDLHTATDDATGLLLTARMLVTDTFQAFGLPEVGHIDEEGHLRLPFFGYFGAGHEAIGQWAERHGAVLATADAVG
jgi:hypothetical protein